MIRLRQRQPPRPRSAATSSRTTRRFLCGRRKRSGAMPCPRWDAARSVARARSGLYLHIPFCRKRCHFCYFRVYTDKNAREVESYLDLLAREWELYGSARGLAGRDLDFVYFGGGTPSFLSTQQLEGLVDAPHRRTPWTQGRGDHVRVRAGHADRSQARGDSADGRDAAEPWRRELRRPHPRDQRTRASLAGDRPLVRVRALARLSADQHRPHRRACSARRTRTGRAASSARWRSIPTASPSTRWSCRTTRRSAPTC